MIATCASRKSAVLSQQLVREAMTQKLCVPVVGKPPAHGALEQGAIEVPEGSAVPGAMRAACIADAAVPMPLLRLSAVNFATRLSGCAAGKPGVAMLWDLVSEGGSVSAARFPCRFV